MTTNKPHAVPRYQPLCMLAQGTSSKVFLARENADGQFLRFVALKKILPELGDNTNALEQFLQRATLVARFQHPNLVQVFEVGKAQGKYFVIMEFLDGVGLGRLAQAAAAQKQLVTADLAAAIVFRSCEALSYAHKLKAEDGSDVRAVHGNLHPGSLVLLANGGVKVIGFGRSTEVEPLSLAYQAPERLGGGPATERSDIFSLGAVLWELLTRTRLFARGDETTTRAAVARDEAPPVRSMQSGVPPALEVVAMRALKKDPSGRFLNLDQMGSVLREYLRRAGTPSDEKALAKLYQSALGEEADKRRELLKQVQTEEQKPAALMVLKLDTETPLPGDTGPRPVKAGTASIPPVSQPVIHPRPPKAMTDPAARRDPTPAPRPLPVPPSTPSAAPEAPPATERAAPEPPPAPVEGPAAALPLEEAPPAPVEQPAAPAEEPAVTADPVTPPAPKEDSLPKTVEAPPGAIEETPAQTETVEAPPPAEVLEELAAPPVEPPVTEPTGRKTRLPMRPSRRVQEKSGGGLWWALGLVAAIGLGIGGYFWWRSTRQPDVPTDSYVPPITQPAGDQPVGDQPAGDQPAGDQPAGDQPAGDQPAGDQPAGDQPAGDQPAGDQPTGDQPAGDQPAGDQPTGDQPAGDQLQISTLTVDSTPTGCRVKLNGKLHADKTPLQDVEVQADRPLVVAVLCPKHKPETQKVNPVAGESLQLTFRPVPLPAGPPPSAGGLLRLNTDPWAEVYLGTRKLGITPLVDVKLPAGRHTLRLVNPKKGVDKKLSVTIRPGKTTSLLEKL